MPVVKEFPLKTNPELVKTSEVLFVFIFAPEPTNNSPDTPIPPVTTKLPEVDELELVLSVKVVTP